MTTVRAPAVAGMFYPDDPETLRSAVHDYVDGAPAVGSAPKAIIVPHAGYVYSGAVAGTAYARLHDIRNQVRRVILLGPSHRVAFAGLAYSTRDAFVSPLGTVALDHAAIESIRYLPQVIALDQAHAQEHSLEVQLPFLQIALDDFQLVPLVVGDATAEEVSEVLECLWGGPETLIVISSDLSHYHDYPTARRMDAATSKAIETLNPSAISYDDACGRIPVSGLLLSARKHGLHVETLDLRNSGDTAGPRDRVVGYGAYAFQ